MLRLCKAVVCQCTLVGDFRVKITNVNSCTLYLVHNVAAMAASIFLIIFIVQAIAEKRILLNDPALLQSQIHALESKVEDVATKNSDLFTKYTEQSGKYTELSTKCNDQSIQFTNLSTKFTDLSTNTTLWWLIAMVCLLYQRQYVYS